MKMRGTVIKQPLQPHNPQKIVESTCEDLALSISSDEELTDTQKQILEHLGSIEQALTMYQLETLIHCESSELVLELDGLQKMGLILKLNTIIPSYASKYPGVRLHDE